MEWIEQKEGTPYDLTDKHDTMFLTHFHYKLNVKKMPSGIETHGQDDRVGNAKAQG
jgi:hypothetical protein